jgi:biopolymer transport protein ExbD
MAGTLGSGKSGGHGAIVGINVTPMVDVVLVLLVIMMVSATYIVSQSLKVELPKAASANEAVQSLAAVTLAKDGSLYFNQQPITEPDLIKKFKESIAANEEMSLIVSADAAVAHGKVVHIIDVAKLEGIVKFAINVEPVK